LGVCQGQGGAPATAKDEMPFWDVEMFAQSFDVGNEVPCRVVFGAGMRLGFTGAALVEEDYTVFFGVEELGVGFGGFAARTAMKEDNYNALSASLYYCAEYGLFIYLSFLPWGHTVHSILHVCRRP
jgi:hypothetical protein